MMGTGCYFFAVLVINVFNQFDFYEMADRMRMDPVPAALALRRMTEVDWPASGASDNSIAYD